MTETGTALHLQLGLTDEEMTRIEGLLGRDPNHLELAMFSVMWSEHCSYKSSRHLLAKLPTQGPQVIVGPGENAGVVDVGDSIAVAIRIESHNHPSAIEPYQGAATGVGGILRDIFTMGARPIALLDCLRFGDLSQPRARWIANGVISGISGYGNSVGVPTVGGEFDCCDTYEDNPLVNVAALGVLRADKLVLGRASQVGDVAILLGAATGRDGIGGVSVLASAGFGDSETDEKKLPSVQVGDPFEEKRLIEACLEMLDAELLSGLQDLGGAGLTCAASETASRGSAGMEVDVSAVPRRQPQMEPFEVMISESQERMLAITSEQNAAAVEQICAKWEIAAARVGRVTDDGRLRIVDSAEVLADLPAAALTDDAPSYLRKKKRPAGLSERRQQDVMERACAQGLGADLLELLASKAHIYSQYDHQLFLNTVVGPGADATLLALRHPDTNALTGRGLGVSADGNHRWCSLDPLEGTAAVVAESVMNLAMVGARPLALVNCLNFGDPTQPEVMWQLSKSIEGMKQACEVFEMPVVGGNVSLYNSTESETGGTNIEPTPVVCALGLRAGLDRPPPGAGLAEGHCVVLLGPKPRGQPRLGGSAWAWDLRGLRGGQFPAPKLSEVAKTASFVAELVIAGRISAAHDVSSGGLALALAEMACIGRQPFFGGVKPRLKKDASEADLPAALVESMFAESHGRALVCCDPTEAADLLVAAHSAGVAAAPLGMAGRAFADGFELVARLPARQAERFEPASLRLEMTEMLAAWEANLGEKLGA